MMPLRAACSRSISSFSSCCRRHRIPVAGPEVGAEHHDAARLQQVQRRRRRSKNRESGRTACSASWSPRRAAPFRPPRCRGRFRAMASLRGISLRSMRSRCGAPMVWPSAAILRTSVGMFGGGLADQEECREHAFLRERRQHLWRGRRPRPVVEGQHHLVILERQRLRKALQADAREVAASTARTREVPSVSLRGQSAACAAAMAHSDIKSAAPASRHQRRGPSGQPSHIWHCAGRCRLGNACSDSSDEFPFCQTGEARHGREYRRCPCRPTAARARPSPDAG